MCGALCSTIVSELLKLKKSLAIHYWQDNISYAKVNNNVMNFYKLLGVSAGSVILHYFSL